MWLQLLTLQNVYEFVEPQVANCVNSAYVEKFLISRWLDEYAIAL